MHTKTLNVLLNFYISHSAVKYILLGGGESLVLIHMSMYDNIIAIFAEVVMHSNSHVNCKKNSHAATEWLCVQLSFASPKMYVDGLRSSESPIFSP